MVGCCMVLDHMGPHVVIQVYRVNCGNRGIAAKTMFSSFGNVNVYEWSKLKLMLHIVGW